jgi:membrane-associated protease RseP (regulator of RpoE activity)
VVAVSLVDASTVVLSYGMIAMLLFSDIRIRSTTPEKYFRRHGIFMALSGAFFTGMSFIENEIALTAVFFAAVPAFLIYWILSEVRFEKRNDYIFHADDTGVQVFFVYEDSPANTMGMKPGDLIVSINGRRVVSPEAVEAFLEDRPPFIWVEALRDGKTFESEYKDYENGIWDLGAVFTPRHPSKFELYPRPGFFRRMIKSFGSLFIRRR